MFARFLELPIKPEKKPDLIKALKNDTLPILILLCYKLDTGR